MPRRLVSCLAVGFALFSTSIASAKPNVELTTTMGGASAGEYLVRVQNPDGAEEAGVIELRSQYTDRALVTAPFEVPAHTTRYFRVPGEAASRCDAVVVTKKGDTVRAQERRTGEGSHIVFDIPPRDEQRLQDLRGHKSGMTTVLSHAVFDESTSTPILPQRAVAYDGVSLVLVRTNVFLRLPATEREALVNWVRMGGAIAFSVSDPQDLVSLSDLVGTNIVRLSNDDKFVAWSGGRLRPATYGAEAAVGLGRIHLLPVDVWSTESNGDAQVQDKLMDVVTSTAANRHIGASRERGALEVVRLLDPNQGYRSVTAIAGVLLVLQALGMAFGYWRIARRRGMGAAYRFVVGTSTATFAVVVGLGIYGKGGFRARAQEIAFADAASGESLGWVERNRAYFSGSERTTTVTPRDASGVVSAHELDELRYDRNEARPVLRVNDKNEMVLSEVRVRPWRTTVVTETGTLSLGTGVRVESKDGKVVVHNGTGSTLRNVIVSNPQARGCIAFGDIESGGEKTANEAYPCKDHGAGWSAYDTVYRDRFSEPVFSTWRLTLIGEMQEGPTTIDGFNVEKRTTLLRVMGGAS